ncbi:MAG: BrnT family toxin [Candidatus Omnitrophica bacterium]|nr:BrnT family toxin [Candidatus Omnitrophota bacterium]
MTSLGQWTGFEWDAGNRGKNAKHRVSDDECEEVFFNLPLLLRPDEAHSQQEERHHVLGQTHAGRRLFIAVTMRETEIRVISARDMTRSERRAYDEAEKANS